jgi:hypothetical protein
VGTSTGARAAGIGQRPRVQGCACLRKTAEDYADQVWRRGQRGYGRSDRDPRRASGGETIDPSGNRRKSQRSESVGLADFDCTAVARRQCIILALAAAVPNRADCMNHMPGRQPISSGNLDVAGRAALECTALIQQFRPGRAMDSTIDAAAAEQRRIGGVNDRVDVKRGDVSDNDLKPRGTELARGQGRANTKARIRQRPARRPRHPCRPTIVATRPPGTSRG